MPLTKMNLIKDRTRLPFWRTGRCPSSLVFKIIDWPCSYRHTVYTDIYGLTPNNANTCVNVFLYYKTAPHPSVYCKHTFSPTQYGICVYSQQKDREPFFIAQGYICSE